MDLLALLPSVVLGAAAHEDPVTGVVLGLAVILLAAKLGAEVAVRIGQPAVLGELVVGVVLGNLALVGIGVFEPLETDVFLDMLARIGVLLLLFEVGLESTVGQMMRVGLPATLVAVIGVVAPFALGWGVSALLLPEQSGYTHAFLGATLAATSVGITARVLQDLGRSSSREARIVLGAAVIDDVLGLIVLTVVAGIIAAADAGGTMSLGGIGVVVLKASVFLVGALTLGVWLSRRLFRQAARLRPTGVLLAVSLAFAFLMSWLAAFVGLAAIVGAFAAGLILEDLHYKDFVSKGEHELEHLIHPLTSFLAPVFFVLMGARVDIASFASGEVLLLALALSVVAIVGKQACSLGAVGQGLDRLSIGIGMVPRGEVGLIFAQIGLTLTFQGTPVLSRAVYSALVLMVIATTMVTPPALKWSLGRHAQRRSSREAPGAPG